MGLDIRWPIGLMFSLVGVLLVIYGAIHGKDAHSPDLNIDLWWGIVLLVFGSLMLWGANKGRNEPPKQP